MPLDNPIETGSTINPLMSEIQARVDAGAQAARDAHATEHKGYGQTSETVYPYTYWWIKGYNDAVDAGT